MSFVHIQEAHSVYELGAASDIMGLQDKRACTIQLL